MRRSSCWIKLKKEVVAFMKGVDISIGHFTGVAQSRQFVRGEWIDL